MDDDLEAIVSFPKEFHDEIGASNIEEDLASPELEETFYDHLDEFHFDVAMFVVEDQEAIEQEVADAVSVIAGEKTFHCIICEKICKSKAGLTRHVNAKHRDKTSVKGKENLASSMAVLTKEELTSIVEKIKAKIIEDGFWDSEITENLAAVTSTVSLYDQILPICKRFCRRRNQDIFLVEFYELIPTSSVLLQCDHQQLGSLIMISIPDHFVSLFKRSNNSQEEPSSEKGISELGEFERGPLSYIAGYVLHKLQKKSQNDELQLILQCMICRHSENPYIEARNRGGLVAPCNDLVQLLEIVEMLFRQFTAKQSTVIKSIPCEKLCNQALDSPVLKSLWENILQGCSQETSKQTKKLCLENIITLYLKVRSFSFAKDYISKFKIQQKAGKEKGLRKELKRKSITDE